MNTTIYLKNVTYFIKLAICIFIFISLWGVMDIICDWNKYIELYHTPSQIIFKCGLIPGMKLYICVLSFIFSLYVIRYMFKIICQDCDQFIKEM